MESMVLTCESFKIAFANLVAAALETSGDTEKQMGKRLNVSRQTIHNWLTGKSLPNAYVAYNFTKIYLQ